MTGAGHLYAPFDLNDVVELARRVPGRPVILIDGGSGAGKTSLAWDLAQAWPGSIQVVSLDSLYPGWDGLAAASAMVASDVLASSGPGYHPWDWAAGRGGRFIPLDPAAPIIIEGCGAITPENRRLSTFALWCDLAADERKRRALARDQDVFAPHWERWARQEAQHWIEHRPWELADLVLHLK